MASDLTFLAVATIGSLGPTLAGLAAWNSSRKNASQKSVDDLHDCVEGLKDDFVEHTEQDKLNFNALRVEQKRVRLALEGDGGDPVT